MGDAVEAKGPAAAGPARTAARPARVVVRWSARREARFLATLADTANVAASIRAAGLSRSTVYRRFRSSDSFRAKWEAALREGFVTLEGQLLDRALNGVKKDVWHGGKRVGTVREFNDRMALALLSHHRARVTETASDAPPPIGREELKARFDARMSAMNKAMGGAG